MPALRRDATAFARAVEAAKAQEDRPREQALAASDGVVIDCTVGAWESNVEAPHDRRVEDTRSWAMRAVVGTSTKTVGGKNDVPSILRRDLALRPILAPLPTASSTKPCNRSLDSDPMVTAPQSTLTSSFDTHDQLIG